MPDLRENNWTHRSQSAPLPMEDKMTTPPTPDPAAVEVLRKLQKARAATEGECRYCRMLLVWSDLVNAWVDVVLHPARDYCPDAPNGRHLLLGDTP